MGLETICRGRGTAGTGEGRLLLETDELIFRGPARVRIPLRTITKVAVLGADLAVTYGEGVMRFTLGVAAPKWAERLLAPPKSRIDKMGIKRGQRVSLIGLSDAAFAAEVSSAGADVTTGRAVAQSDHIVVEVNRLAELERFKALRAKLTPAGGLWVVHRKGKEGIKDTEIFAAGKKAGLTANKVARFSDTHTAERLVVPRADR